MDRAAALADASSLYMVRCDGGEFPEMFEKAMLKCEALRIFFQINDERSYQFWDIARLINVATLNYERQARALIEKKKREIMSASGGCTKPARPAGHA